MGNHNNNDHSDRRASIRTDARTPRSTLPLRSIMLETRIPGLCQDPTGSSPALKLRSYERHWASTHMSYLTTLPLSRIALRLLSERKPGNEHLKLFAFCLVQNLF